ncbi:MAG: rod shape-determining protein MreD [Myxococcota bacterium]|nr:rod shape-determining protein MreD [Myxococcota bacterium]
MKHGLVIWLAWTCVALQSTLGIRWNIAGVMPDVAVVFVCFWALQRSFLSLSFAALGLGVACDVFSGAPLGFHGLSLCLCAFGVRQTTGAFSRGGIVFFGSVVALVTVAHHGLMYGMLWGGRGDAFFSSWATASLLPTGFITGLVAVLSYPVLCRLEAWVQPPRSGALLWN